MKRVALRRVAMVVLASTALLVLGCSEDPAEVGRHRPPVLPKLYKSLTEKENLIYNLMQCYKEHNLPRYEELLHPDFIWYNQPQDVSSGLPEFYTKSEDSLITRNIFFAAEHSHPEPNMWLDKLELAIAQPGTWTPVAEINGIPRTDCWETTREYYLVLMKAGGAVTYIANDLVKFIVVPVEANGTKLYKIIRCDDIRRP